MTSAYTPRDRALTAAALILALFSAFAGVGAAALTLTSSNAADSMAGAASAAVGAWFVGMLVGLLPGCLAVMLVAAAPLLSTRQKVVGLAAPVGALTLAAVLPALVVGVGAPRWASVGVTILVAAGVSATSGKLLWDMWRTVPGVSAATKRGPVSPGPVSAADAESGADVSSGVDVSSAGALLASSVALSSASSSAPFLAASDLTPADSPLLTEEDEEARADRDSLRTHRNTPRVGAWLVLAAAALTVAGTIVLARSAAFLPPAGVTGGAVLPAWYTLTSGLAAASFLWGPLWLTGAVLLQVSTGATRAASRLAWALVPMLAVISALALFTGWGVAQVGAPHGLARALAVLLALASAAGVGVWAWRAAPMGARELLRLLMSR